VEVGAVTTRAEDLVCHGYLAAKERIVATGDVAGGGYSADIEWAEQLRYVRPDPQYVLQEGAWVIVNSGFRYAVAQKLWPWLLEAFHHFEPDKVNWGCIPDAMMVLAHEKKLAAIVTLADIVRTEGIETLLEQAKDPLQLTRLPYIGKVTCWHFAKVLGADVVKPDVHLERAAKAAGYPTPLAMCEMIRGKTGDRLTVIDSVLWRYGEQREKRGWATWAELFGSP
jgi:hypothetical protein